MRTNFALYLVAVSFLSLPLWAQESSTSSSDSIRPALRESTSRIDRLLGNRQFDDSFTLTDAKLRADDGSLSRYSLKFNLSYYGPTLNDWSAADQPNPNGSNGPYSTALGGSMTARYRLSPDRTISMGTGLKAIHPFNGMERFDLNSPFMSYDMSSRVFDVQMRNSPSVGIVTIPEYKRVGEFASVGWDNSLVKDLGTSRFAVGMDSSFGYYFYNRSYKANSSPFKHDGDGKANQYSISFNPNMKYNFTRKFSVNTSLGFSFWNPREKNNALTLWNNLITQRFGMGYSLARDIYFAPYLNTYPSRLALDTTTFNFSTIFSIL